MILNIVLLIIVVVTIILLVKQLRHTIRRDHKLIPICHFIISDPDFTIDLPVRIVRFSVYSKNKYRYFRDFPIGFKFYSDSKFKSTIKITYTISGDDEVEVIYDKIVEFEDHAREHIYYINDVIIGAINVEIHTESNYGKPTIEFELLQGNVCHMDKEHKLILNFSE